MGPGKGPYLGGNPRADCRQDIVSRTVRASCEGKSKAFESVETGQHHGGKLATGGRQRAMNCLSPFVLFNIENFGAEN